MVPARRTKANGLGPASRPAAGAHAVGRRRRRVTTASAVPRSADPLVALAEVGPGVGDVLDVLAAADNHGERAAARRRRPAPAPGGDRVRGAADRPAGAGPRQGRGGGLGEGATPLPHIRARTATARETRGRRRRNDLRRRGLRGGPSARAESRTRNVISGAAARRDPRRSRPRVA